MPELITGMNALQRIVVTVRPRMVDEQQKPAR
jgi:hypothetical protein